MALRPCARLALIAHEHWFLAQDGGYPPDLEPLVGMFQSPAVAAPEPVSRVRRRRTSRDRRRSGARPPSIAISSCWPTRSAARPERAGSSPGLVGGAVRIRPAWAPRRWRLRFAISFRHGSSRRSSSDREQLFERAAALALPLLGRFLDELSATLTTRLDADTLSLLGAGRDVDVSDHKKKVLVRGMLRQGLQVLAGSEAAVATKAAQLLLRQVPGTPPAAARSARRPAALGARLRHVRSVHRHHPHDGPRPISRAARPGSRRRRALPTGGSERRCRAAASTRLASSRSGSCGSSRARPGTASCAPIPPGPRSDGA